MTDRKDIRRKLASAVLCGVVLLGLQGCAEMMLGTAVAGSFVAIDRRTLGTQTDDKSILIKGELRAADLVGDAGHVNVVSFNRKVLITGEVRDEAMKTDVAREMAQIGGVNSVVNELTIGPVSTLMARSEDTYITTKVLANFVDAKDIYSNAFKVVTERGTVYLMGRVTQREGARGAEIASGLSGVRRVVKVYDYITEEELRQLSVKRQQATAPVEGEGDDY